MNPRQPDGTAGPRIAIGTFRLTARAEELVLDALRRHRLSYGPMTRRFEEAFASLHECRFGIMSNSGTSALQVALQAMKELHGWMDGDEVLVPAITFVSTVNVVLHNRMQPVLVDVDPAYYAVDPARLEAAISPRTRAVIPVHPFGQPADMGPIQDIARRHGLKLIEDSCETLFARYQGRRVGSLGDIGCFSTYMAHLIVTGVGGLNTTNDPDYAVRLRSLINHGRDPAYLSIDDDDQLQDDALPSVVARRFRFTSIGHSFRATEMEAALGLAQLEGWQAMIAARQANASRLRRELSPLASRVQLPDTRPGNEHVFMMFPMVLRDEAKEPLVEFLEAHGVETRDMLPITNQPVYQRMLGWRERDFPVAERINRQGFYMGCHQDLSAQDLAYVTELFMRHVRGRPATQQAAVPG